MSFPEAPANAAYPVAGSHRVTRPPWNPLSLQRAGCPPRETGIHGLCLPECRRGSRRSPDHHGNGCFATPLRNAAVSAGGLSGGRSGGPGDRGRHSPRATLCPPRRPARSPAASPGRACFCSSQTAGPQSYFPLRSIQNGALAPRPSLSTPSIWAFSFKVLIPTQSHIS